jgi:hypothetical protein
MLALTFFAQSILCQEAKTTKIYSRPHCALQELLVRLHDDQLPPSEEVDVLMRGMNELVMDVLHGAKPNAVYTLLIRFLYEGAPLSGGRDSTPGTTSTA